MVAETRSPRDVSWVRKVIDRFKARRQAENDPGGVAGGGTSQAVGESKAGGTTADRFVGYKEYRIHTSPHLTGLWISMIVSSGKPMPVTNDSLTGAVTRVPGEYPSEAEALLAAKQYIDHLEGSV